MTINLEAISNIVSCKYKSYLKINNIHGNKSDYECFHDEQRNILLETAISNIISKGYKCLNLENDFMTKELGQTTDYVVNTQLPFRDFSIHCDIIEKLPDNVKGNPCKYVPVLVTPYETISKEDRYRLFIIALALSELLGCKVKIGKIIHPSATKTVKLNQSSRLIDKILNELNEMLNAGTEPSLLINKNCRSCEFNSHCFSKAEKDDNLSLLSGITLKEIKKYNSKGIFTVNQLSYTFRPRRKRKKSTKSKQRFVPELKALAIRENKIYVYNNPSLQEQDKEIYFDFEGINDRSFCYLIGVIIKDNGNVYKHYYWANNVDDEVKIFNKFISLLNQYEGYTFYHYGSYEIKHMKRIIKKLAPHGKRQLDKIIKSCCNLLSFFYSNIYVPTYSNELKAIGKYLGFKWTDYNASGMQSVIWRKKWEITKNNSYKEALIQYNEEDCEVLLKVKSLISDIIKKQNNAAIYCDNLASQSRFSFQSKNFALEEIDFINKCSYFDYQRERIYARINPVIRKSQVNVKKKAKNNLKPNQEVHIKAKTCPLCRGKQLKIGTPISKKVIDLKFHFSGVKKWIVKYSANRYTCIDCKKVVLPIEYLKIKSLYGHNLISWTIYQHIVNKESFRQIALNLQELFSLYIPKTNLHTFKRYFVQYYEYTYKGLIKKILNSQTIYIDETPLVMTTETGYGWVLTNVEEVISFYKPTREGEFLKDYFKDYNGILVSDFYAAYDTIDCPQQKCLIHLMRDMNDDLLKNPFDYEFKQLTQAFTLLLQSIVKTIDKYGLRKRNLHKHKKEADRFLLIVENGRYTSDVCQQYQKRIVKNKESLFLFLMYDNVSWNNNNAEHAIKLLATHSNKNMATFKSTRMDDYLKIMSIYQTCKYKGISFLKFLLSGEKNIDVFVRKNHGK